VFAYIGAGPTRGAAHVHVASSQDASRRVGACRLDEVCTGAEADAQAVLDGSLLA
jgi:hypothetical protein